MKRKKAKLGMAPRISGIPEFPSEWSNLDLSNLQSKIIQIEKKTGQRILSQLRSEVALDNVIEDVQALLLGVSWIPQLINEMVKENLISKEINEVSEKFLKTLSLRIFNRFNLNQTFLHNFSLHKADCDIFEEYRRCRLGTDKSSDEPFSYSFAATVVPYCVTLKYRESKEYSKVLPSQLVSTYLVITRFFLLLSSAMHIVVEKLQLERRGVSDRMRVEQLSNLERMLSEILNNLSHAAVRSQIHCAQLIAQAKSVEEIAQVQHSMLCEILASVRLDSRMAVTYCLELVETVFLFDKEEADATSDKCNALLEKREFLSHEYCDRDTYD